MSDEIPDGLHVARPHSVGANGRPIRKDEMELPDLGLYVESWMPERRSRRRPLLFIHGELTGSWIWDRYLSYFAGRGWEGHALNLRNHYWSETTDIANVDFEDYLEDVLAVLARLGQSVVAVGHGMGGLLALKAAERQSVGAAILLDSELPRDLRRPVRPHELRMIPDVYGRDLIGWETLPEKLQRRNRDLTIADIVRMQHLLGQKPHESGLVRRQILEGIAIDRSRLVGVPILVVGAGLDGSSSATDAERLADWLGGTYEPFGAHSHYGLVIGESSFQQVADGVRIFLESHRM
ncbi:MAG: alpha/beta fold hydrolase [Candidatus Limnocylindrales bacterium]|jgi:pimeloyl-ACP methyl ester carboxylesterase